MTLSLARSERRGLCDLLAALGPDAPTMCEGWTARHLAAHLRLRETDPITGIGIVVKPMKRCTEQRMAALLEEHDFDELVELVRQGPGRLNPMSWPGVDKRVNSLEFFVHHEDLRRGGDRAVRPRVLTRATDDWLWDQAQAMATRRLRRVRVGVLLQRVRDTRPTDEQTAVSTGRGLVTVRGEPGELVLWLFGRQVTEVEFSGAEGQLAALRDLDLSV